MQEEIEMKTVTLISRCAGVTTETLKNTFDKYLAYRSAKKRELGDYEVVPKTGRQSYAELTGQGQGVMGIPCETPCLRELEKCCRRYGVDYSVKRDMRTHTPKYMFFFKAPDRDLIDSCLREYSERASLVLEGERKPSVLKELAKKKALVRAPGRTRNREIVR